MRCATLCGMALRGARCRTTFRLGRRFTNRPNAGSRPDVLRLWHMICALFCGWPPVAMKNRRRPLLIAAPCDRRRRVVPAPVTMVQSGSEAKVHMAVDALGHLLALHVTPADVGDREAVARLAADIQDATGDAVDLAYVDQGYTGHAAANAAAAEGITLEVVKLPEAKRGFVLLPRRWVVERSFAWATRCRRLVKDYERYAETLAGLHIVAFVGYMLKQAAALMQSA